MPHRNRLTPQGELIATPARGMFLGNRGCLHDADGTIVRPYQLTRWIYCVPAFKGRRRPLLQPGRYTELFFLDEATALAAGHRPCAECQRARYDDYLAHWGRIHPQDSGPLRAGVVDAALHAERIDDEKVQRSHAGRIGDLPDGVMLLPENDAATPHLLWRHLLFRWSPSGYVLSGRRAAQDMRVRVLTPPSTVAALRNGFSLTPHPSLPDASKDVPGDTA